MKRYGIGIIMLDTRFPRPVGDIGNRESFADEDHVFFRRVPGASAHQAVRGDVDALLKPFITAGKDLLDEGVAIIGTSCGFLSLFQRELEDALGVPVIASALSLAALVPDRAGILTIDAEALTERHLRAAGITTYIPIVGLPADGELATVVFEDRLHLDMERVEVEMMVAAKRLVSENPSVDVIILECTNMGPYQNALSRELDLPVLTIINALEENY